MGKIKRKENINMSLFIICTSIVFVLLTTAVSVKVLIDYCFNKANRTREAKIADRHDKMLQETHFKDIEK